MSTTTSDVVAADPDGLFVQVADVCDADAGEPRILSQRHRGYFPFRPR